MSKTESSDAPIEERALRFILGNQALIMQALAALAPTMPIAGGHWAIELRDRAAKTEEWKNANLRN